MIDRKKLGYIGLISMSVFATVLPGAQLSPVLGAEETKRPSAIEGRALSEKFCKGCHLIDGLDRGTAQVGPPSFSSIANKSGQTAKRIENVLIQPHSPMPDMHLTYEEILNIIAYLDTLRTDPTAPPLLSPKGADKQKYPEPT